MSVGYPIDLHTHSRRSDGILAPAELIAAAAARGVRVQALSDHDTLAGVGEATAAGQALGVRVIPAIELNTESEWGDVHVLGYFLDPDDAALEVRLAELRRARVHRIELMVERLDAGGYAVSLDRVMALAHGGALGRPHLAVALAEAGHVPTPDAGFETLIAKGSPFYVPKAGLAPLEAVELVRAHGGVPAMAHPGTARCLEELLPRLASAGLAGIECYYGSHSPAFTAACLGLARRNALVPTGGSDFHGWGAHGAPLGGVFVSPEAVEALEARRREVRLPSKTVGRTP